MLLRLSPILLLLATPLVLDGASSQAAADEPSDWVAANLDELIELYRYFHMHPELSFYEEETGKKLGEELSRAGMEVTYNVGGFGVVSILENGDGPTLMLRTDLDALPVTEQTNLVYASKVKVEDGDGKLVGVMHACGHDVHITNIIGVARFLSQHKDLWQGRLMIIGQPAEERGAGARAMLEDGLFERFQKPDFAVALHVDSTQPAGTVALSGGFTLANVDSVDITFHGRGGHGAQPHSTIDPIVEAAEFVVAVQTIVSREIKPIEPAVITVGSIHGGTKHNIIGDACHLQITVRSYSDGVRKQLLDGISRKAKAVAIGARAPEPTIHVSEGTPALRNDDELAAHLRKVFETALGPDRVNVAEPSMGGEDFSRYGRAGVPILMYRLGAVEQKRLDRYAELGQESPSLHSPIFYPDIEKTLSTGLVSMSSAALELLKK